MKRLVAGVAVILASAVVAPAPAAAATVPACVKPGEKVLARSPALVVVAGRRLERMIGCRRTDGVRRTVWKKGPFIPNGDRSFRPDVQIAGLQVAYVGVDFCTVCQPYVYETVHVVDVATGRSREILKAHDPRPYWLNPRIRAFAVNSCGALASIAAPSGFSAGGRNFDADRQLRLVLDGEPILLDAGLIELGSLRVTPSRVLWRRDGVPREHLLPARCPRSGQGR